MKVSHVFVCGLICLVATLMIAGPGRSDSFETAISIDSIAVGYHAIPTSSGGYIIAGYASDSDVPGAKAFLAMLDSSGDTLWTRSFGDTTSIRLFQSVAETSAGGFLAMGQKWDYIDPALMYLVLVDVNGDTIWTKTAGSQYDVYARKMRRCQDGSLAIVGSEFLAPENDAVFLLRIDENGDTLSYNSYDNGDGYQIRDVVQLATGEYVIVGRIDVGAGLENGFVLCLDSLRTSLWQDTVAHENYLWLDAVADAGSSVAMAGGTMNIVPWTTAPQSMGERELLNSLAMRNSSNQISLKSPMLPSATGEDDIILALIDASPAGGVLWTRRYGTTFDESVYGITSYSDHLLLATGLTTSFSQNDYYEGWTLLLDAFGDTVMTNRYLVTENTVQFNDIETTPDEGYLTTGYVSPDLVVADVYIVKDDIPNIVWFTASENAGTAPLSVQFNDASTFTATSWEWDFDSDGIVDETVQNPTYIYQYPGTYSVSLVAHNSSHNDSLTRDYLIEVTGFPMVDFGAVPTEGVAPLTVNFSDSSAYEPTAWAWDFESDGIVDATEQNPSHIYSLPDTYDVTLITMHGTRADTLSKQEYIKVELLDAEFSATPTVGPVPLTVSFTDMSSGHPSGWQWDFDSDGAIDDTTQNPTFEYVLPDTYSVILIVTRGTKADTLTKNDYIIAEIPRYIVKPDGTGDYPNIQTALDSVPAGSIVELTSGVFSGNGNRSISFGGKALRLRSQAGDPDSCTIDCNNGGRGFLFDSGEDENSIIEGITITRGVQNGGAIQCDGASPAIINCKLVSNSSDEGSALYCLGGANPTLTDCIMSHNTCRYNGGAIYCATPSAPIFRYCVITHNTSGQMGGGVFATSAGAQPEFHNCTFLGNTADYGAAAYVQSAGCHFINTIIAFNSANQAVMGGGTAVCCNIYSNTGGAGSLDSYIGVDGNIAVDPLFCNQDEGDLRLFEESPCTAENNPSCGFIGAYPLGCLVARFSADPSIGHIPLTVQFTDERPEVGTSYEWDFHWDGSFDVESTEQNPVFVYEDQGPYSVVFRKYDDGVMTAKMDRYYYIKALGNNNLILHTAEILTSDPTPIAVEYDGIDSLGAISLYFTYDDTKISYAGIQSHVEGEFFSGGIVGDRISVQWFDETGGLDPIIPGPDADTLFSLLFTNVVTADSTQVKFDRGDCLLGDKIGNPIPDIFWVHTYPNGMIYINIGAIVSGRVEYYWLDKDVPGVLLSMGPPNPDVLSSLLGEYLFERYPMGYYTLDISKSDDLGGINSLDAIKVIRHSTGQELLENSYKEQAANVNGDGYINALDAIKIVRGAVGLEMLASGDWVFEPSSASFSPLSDDVTQDFVAVRMGDVNGDWIATDNLPQAPFTLASISDQEISTEDISASIRQSPAQGPILVSLPDTILYETNDSLQIAVQVVEFMDIGAISFRIQFDDTLFAYDALESNCSATFTSNIVGNEIRIEWYDPTGGASPLTVPDGDLLTLHFDLLGSAPDTMQLDFTSQSMLGDSNGDPIVDVTFLNGNVYIATETTDIEDSEIAAVPQAFVLYQNVPNPFNPATTIYFDLPRPEHVKLSVYNVKGELVATLEDRLMSEGRKEVIWKAEDNRGRTVSSGVYFYRLVAGEFVQTRKMVLLR